MIRWTAEASDNLIGIHDYITQYNPAAADRQCRLIGLSIEQLASFAKLGKPTRVKTVRKLVVPQTNYIVFYRIEESAVTVLRILHGAMRRPKNLG